MQQITNMGPHVYQQVVFKNCPILMSENNTLFSQKYFWEKPTYILQSNEIELLSNILS